MNPWYSLSSKHVWIVGGAGYLGSAITRTLDAECAKVLCFDLPSRAEALVAEHGLQRTIPLSLDAREADLSATIDALVATHGVPDGMVYLAFASSRGHPFATLPASEFQRTFDLSLGPAFTFCRQVADHMKGRLSGSVVLFASMYGMVSPDPRVYPDGIACSSIDYGASKAALLQMNRYLAMQYGTTGVRFNCVTPGPCPNPGVQKASPQFIANLAAKTVLRRIGTADDVVGPALFLLSDSASYITGHSLVVDGGWTTL